MIHCRCCLQPISLEAKACPQCGQPDPMPNMSDVMEFKKKRQFHNAAQLYSSIENCSFLEAAKAIEKL
jgi:hypothetical protein